MLPRVLFVCGPIKARRVSQGAMSAVFSPRSCFMWQCQAHAEPGRMPEQGHGRDVFNGRKVPSDHYGAAPNVEWKTVISSKLNQESASP